jgi:hypothetical protein
MTAMNKPKPEAEIARSRRQNQESIKPIDRLSIKSIFDQSRNHHPESDPGEQAHRLTSPVLGENPRETKRVCESLILIQAV